MHGNLSVTSGEGQVRALESWAARRDGKRFSRGGRPRAGMLIFLRTMRQEERRTGIVGEKGEEKTNRSSGQAIFPPA